LTKKRKQEKGKIERKETTTTKQEDKKAREEK